MCAIFDWGVKSHWEVKIPRVYFQRPMKLFGNMCVVPVTFVAEHKYTTPVQLRGATEPVLRELQVRVVLTVGY